MIRFWSESNWWRWKGFKVGVLPNFDLGLQNKIIINDQWLAIGLTSPKKSFSWLHSIIFPKTIQ